MAKRNDDNVMGMLAHLLGLFTGFVGPLVMYLMLRDRKGTALANARHALNFQISLIIYYIISGILVFVLIGFLLMGALSLFAFIAIIIGTVKAANGEEFKYPLEIQFLK